jgi:glycosyltransferase involved in cell wall biosynthesis
MLTIASITAGAAGMFCGSCMRDNTLVAALLRQGHDAFLISTYMPIRTDEVDVSQGKIFYGGINVYLQEKSWFFRHAPRWLDWLFNRRWLLKWASKQAVTVDYADFAELTLSMLKGTDGRQSKELEKLVDWLKDEIQPDVVILTNALLSGLVPEIVRKLQVPVVVTLQGDDVFLNALPQQDREICIRQIATNDKFIHSYIATCQQYANDMATYFGISREKIHVVYPGIQLEGYSPAQGHEAPLTLGYFARICPEKGFHNLVDAFITLRQQRGAPVVKLRASGWKGPQYQAFYDTQIAKLRAANLLADFEYVDSPDHASKAAFLQSLDVFCLPTDYHEPKGLSVLEAWASSLPVVLPRHGSFPELVEKAHGGLLYEPGNRLDLVAKLRTLLEDAELRNRLGKQGRSAVEQHFTADQMALATAEFLQSLVHPVS